MKQSKLMKHTLSASAPKQRSLKLHFPFQTFWFPFLKCTPHADGDAVAEWRVCVCVIRRMNKSMNKRMWNVVLMNKWKLQCSLSSHLLCFVNNPFLLALLNQRLDRLRIVSLLLLAYSSFVHIRFHFHKL